ncbi:glycoside hydrolase family 73 protein [Fructobacillus sp. M1-13]|uniref:Glycoside hydrolase family 73 protein n=1 Tax=Fructobacillus papyriferae TaxID=2713171 RepID=A0ABS5QR21_9LACO|nr:glycoside hydrolase family 73 protein [Fructobacillus papyriferae]MBS9334955.1 glycoside hydrolase family 73 protein [Fructobacillus papyriferae]MCD2159561.1 glycoside hydrolase family 73 protein [Fructobacillus papyriferae]
MARKKHKWFKLPRRKKDRRRYFIALFALISLVVAAASLTPEFLAERKEAQVEDQRSKQLKAWAPYAQQLQRQYGVFASISLAQAALESDFGQSTLAQQAHNLYGVKAAAGQPSVTLPTKEYTADGWTTVEAPFVSYASWQASMLAHAKLLKEGTSWNPTQYAHVLSAANYREAAQGLVTDRYATDPDYAEKLIQVIEKYHLHRFDLAD